MKNLHIILYFLISFSLLFSSCQKQGVSTPVISPQIEPSRTNDSEPTIPISSTPVIKTPTPELPAGIATPISYSETIINKDNISNIKEVGFFKPPFNLIRMSENGKYIYKITDKQILIYDSANQNQLFRKLDIPIILNPDNTFNKNYFGLSFSGQNFFAVTNEGIQVYSINGDLEGTFIKPAGDFSISLNPDSTLIAFVRNDDIQVNRVSDKKIFFTGKGKKIKFSSNGIYAGIQLQTKLNILDLDNWKVYKDFPQDAELGWNFSKDGTWVASIHNYQIQIYDLLNKKIIKKNIFGNNVAFSFDNKKVASIYDPGNNPHVSQAWLIEDFSEIEREKINHKDWPFISESLLWKSGIKGQLIGINSKSIFFINEYSNDQYYYLCELNDKSVLECNAEFFMIHNFLSKQGNVCIAIYDPPNLNDFNVNIYCNDNEFSFLSNEYGQIAEKYMQYDLLALDEEQKIALVKKSSEHFLAQSRLIDLNSKSIMEKWTRTLDHPIISPDGHYLAFMYKTVINVYDLKNRKLLGFKEIGNIESLIFSKDSKNIAITYFQKKQGEFMNQIKVLEVAKIIDIHYQPAKLFEQKISKSVNFSNEIRSIDYSNDDSVLLIGLFNGEIIGINSQNGDIVINKTAFPAGGLLNLKFYRDGKSLITTASDGSFKIWGIANH